MILINLFLAKKNVKWTKKIKINIHLNQQYLSVALKMIKYITFCS